MYLLSKTFINQTVLKTAHKSLSSKLFSTSSQLKATGAPFRLIDMKNKQGTFSLDDTLPRLPIPTLEETAALYLKSLKPLLNPTEFERSQKAVEEFIKPNGLGQTLQNRLKNVDQEEPYSWLERWWLRVAYHSWREPLIVNSNWYMIAAPHPSTPKSILDPNSSTRKNLEKKGNFSSWQVKRAAGIINYLLDFKDNLESDSVPTEKTKIGPLDMSQYKHIFGVTRIPKSNCDVNYDIFPTPATHITVLVRDQIFKVPVYDSQNSTRIRNVDIESLLQKCIDQVEALKTEDYQPPVGLFTALHRDKWADIHQRIEDHSQINRDSFREIEESIFTVSLDDYCLPLNDTKNTAREYLAKNTFHGMDGHNRWFDKCISVIFMNDGNAGMNGEHSPCDALIPAYIFDAALDAEHGGETTGPRQAPTSLKEPELLKWKLPKSVQDEIPNAELDIKKTIDDSDVRVLRFTGYGSKFIKSVGKCSPDAYMQMAIQLTYYRIHKQVTPVYETASTRMFKHGRTETTRSLSSYSKNFVEVFDSDKSVEEKYAALQEACKQHINYIGTASKGKGVDRHLLGLRLCLKEGESAEIFKDPAYGNSSNWRLSTSGLFEGPNILATGFGAVVPDGYGMNYMIMSSEIKVGIESKHSCPETSTSKFRDGLRQSLLDISEVCQEVQSKSTLSSKL